MTASVAYGSRVPGLSYPAGRCGRPGMTTLPTRMPTHLWTWG